jgi:hypothetical protein
MARKDIMAITIIDTEMSLSARRNRSVTLMRFVAAPRVSTPANLTPTSEAVSANDHGTDGLLCSLDELEGFAFLMKKEKFGGRDRDRTCDLMLAKHALSQLSYTPTTPSIDFKAFAAVRKPPNTLYESARWASASESWWVPKTGGLPRFF